jgi:hypothetical protein
MIRESNVSLCLSQMRELQAAGWMRAMNFSRREILKELSSAIIKPLDYFHEILIYGI